MTEHLWAAEHLSDFVTGMLTADENQRLAQHLAGCAECTQSLAEWRQFDDGLSKLFADDRPAANVQDRVIQGLRSVRRPRPWLAMGAGLAAAVLLGVVGFGMHRLSESGLPLPGNGFVERLLNTKNEETSSGLALVQSSTQHGYMIVDKSNLDSDHFEGMRRLMEREAAIVLDSSGSMESESAPDSRRASTYYHRNGPVGAVMEKYKWFGESAPAIVNNGVVSNSDSSVAGPGIQWMSRDGDQQKRDFGSIGLGTGTMANYGKKKNTQGSHVPEFGLALEVDGQKSKGGDQSRIPDSHQKLIESLNSTMKIYPHQSSVAEGKGNLGVYEAEVKKWGEQVRRLESDAERGVVDNRVLRETQHQLELSIAQRNAAKEKAGPLSKSLGAENPGDFSYGDKGKKGSPRDAPSTGGEEAAPEFSDVSQPGKQPAGPADDSRKIIRTGELEFDVASFDAALKDINLLLTPSRKKGGVVATTNSDKLANGKMKGSVVVRIPPEFLDEFVRDLRKLGDLKSQRIGSVEVTKQYTDNEAELRGLRITQERCEDIVKKGKGDTKDLIAAELLLNEVRTRIEKIEGENRYFNNQVALCTLTIRLVEKEIQNAAMLVFNEMVTLTFAVEELQKAEDSVRTAVDELKGRVLKSDAKRQDGVVQMELEVAHEHAAKLRARLGELGDNIFQDEVRSQQTEGGSTLGPQPKIRHADVRFSVTLRDLAGIKPRKIFHRKIASAEVFKSVARVRAEVLNKKGRITEDQSNEVADQARTTATLEFDLPVQHREDIDKLLKDLGDQVEQSSVQLPQAESTKRKIGYKLTFVNLATQPPREAAILVVEVRNVDASMNELRAMFREARGTITFDRGPFDDKGELKGQISSVVPLSSKQDLVKRIRGMGTVKKQDFVSDPQAPESSLPLAALAIQFVAVPSIVPGDEALWPQTRTSLYYAFRVLTMSVMFVVVGLCLVLPWTVIGWVTVKAVRWVRGRSAKV